MSRGSDALVSRASSRPPEWYDRTKTIRTARRIRPSRRPSYAAVWYGASATRFWSAASWLRSATRSASDVWQRTRLWRPASDEWSVQPAAARCLPAPTALRRPTGHANATTGFRWPASWHGARLRRRNEPAARAVRRAATGILQCRSPASTAANGSGKPSSGSVTTRAGRGHADESGTSSRTRFEVGPRIPVDRTRTLKQGGKERACGVRSACRNARTMTTTHELRKLGWHVTLSASWSYAPCS